jgi:hypothetical protein
MGAGGDENDGGKDNGAAAASARDLEIRRLLSDVESQLLKAQRSDLDARQSDLDARRSFAQAQETVISIRHAFA